MRVGFEDRSPCVWTRGLSDLELPVRHGEGRLVFAGALAQSRLEDAGHVCVRYRSITGGPPAYPENPSGSTAAAAGLCDASGRVFGLMPHPEAFLDPVNHPRWTRSMPARADGLLLLENGVRQSRGRMSPSRPTAIATVCSPCSAAAPCSGVLERVAELDLPGWYLGAAA